MLHFLLSFTANLVTLPSVDVFLSTALMTPVAAICLMSCTTKWPEEEGRMRHRREDSLPSVRNLTFHPQGYFIYSTEQHA